MTERVRPLQAVLDSWSLKGSKEKEDWLLWGLHRVSVCFDCHQLLIVLMTSRSRWPFSTIPVPRLMETSALHPSSYHPPANGNLAVSKF